MYLRNVKSSEFKKEKEVSTEKSQGSNLTNLLTLNNFIDFSDRISKLERENERLQKLQHISQARSEQKIGKVEREKDGLNDLNLKLEREHNVFQAQYIY